MKRDLVNLVAVIGLILLGSALVLGLLTGILFIFPKASIFGAKSVNERDTQVIYRDAELAKAFANGKLILESSGTPIKVKMSNDGYDGQNTIVVNESATGIAFNSLNRTLIEWTQTLYNEELYYRIKILEPSGMVFQKTPTVVYINLPYRNDDFKYDFVLQNQYSNVDFSLVDEVSGLESIRINNLIVESASSVMIPYGNNNSVDNISIKSNKTKFTCQSPVLKNVFIHGSNNVINFGNGSSAGIVGNVTIDGNNNSFVGTTANKVKFNADNGSLSLSQTIASLDVETKNAKIDVKTVSGVVKMSTMHGGLHVGSIGNGLQFTAGSAKEPHATASLNVDKVTGDITADNYGVGVINLNGVDGDVSINSYHVDGGAINVNFVSGASASVVNIVGYDGDITVRNINGGKVDITVFGERSRAGAANINMQFNEVGLAEIRSGAYISGHDNWGNVNVNLSKSCNAFDFYVFYARSANSSAVYGYQENNMNISNDESDLDSAKNRINGGNGGSCSLKVYCQNRVYLS